MAKGKGAAAQAELRSGTVGVFISWSGEPSKGIAEALSALISDVFQDVTTFVSSNNIEAGSHWFGRIAQELARTNFGILCLTPANLDKQWIHFEAGALAKQITEQARVVPYLHGVSPSDLSPPLNMFNGVKSDQDGTHKLLKSLNETRPGQFEQGRLNQVFEKWWPDFAEKLRKLPNVAPAAVVPPRAERDILEELLARVKGVHDAGFSQDPNLSRTDVAAARAQLAIKIADVEVKRLEMERQPGFHQSYVLSGVVHELNQELARLRQIG